MSSVRRIERGKHWAIGSYVIAEVRTVTGGNGRYQEHWTRSLYPKAQSGINQHPRHPTGFDLKTGLPNACVSPSCSFYADLCKYGEFKWAA